MAEPLRGFAKLVRASEGRRTRFHTERGELLPPRALPDAARSVGRRIVGGSRPDKRPWMIPSAVAALERRLGTASRVLELGAGSSTSWLAERVAEVVSYEADAAWAAGVDAALAREGHRNVTILQVPVDDTPAALRESAGEAFDVVIVDCYETPRVTRLDCLVAAAPLVGRRGCLVLDDSDRVQLRDAPAHLPGWRVERHVGMKQFPLMATETSLFWRPGDADPD